MKDTPDENDKILPHSVGKQGASLEKTGAAMQTVLNGYRGLSLLLGLNWDRIFTLGTIVVGLLAGAFLGAALAPMYQ